MTTINKKHNKRFYERAPRKKIVKIKHQINLQISENGVEEIDLEERPATAQCSVCGEFGLHSKIKHHIYRHHKDIEDKKVKFVNKTYHSCRLCSKKVVFTEDCIYGHIR